MKLFLLATGLAVGSVAGFFVSITLTYDARMSAAESRLIANKCCHTADEATHVARQCLELTVGNRRFIMEKANASR